MNTPWLLIDVSNLAYRNFYAGKLEQLDYETMRNEIVQGILRDVLFLQELHSTNNIAFCFDRGRSKRALYYQEYKANRRGQIDQEARRILKSQIRELHNTYLNRIGFRNLFSQDGYEADDLIASICLNSLDKRQAIICSTDNDLLQLLSGSVSIWNSIKKRMITGDSFRKLYGISPTQWVDVKALSGCSSDNIEGIRGIGEKTAIKHLQGKLKPNSKAFNTIIKNTKIWERNFPLVQLPFKGTRACRLQPDQIKPSGWKSVMKELKVTNLKC